MLMRDALPLSDSLLCVSGRTSFEIVQKAHLAGIPFVATLHGRRGGFWGRTFKIWRFEQALKMADVIVHSEDHRRDRVRHKPPRADIATLGFAISLITFASVALADCFCVFLLVIHL